MDIQRLKKSEMGETEYTHGGKYVGIPKDSATNWVTLMFINNPHLSLADIVKMPKFKAQENRYHYMIVELDNGVKHGMLFFDKKCVADVWSQLENVEIINNK